MIEPYLVEQEAFALRSTELLNLATKEAPKLTSLAATLQFKEYRPLEGLRLEEIAEGVLLCTYDPRIPLDSLAGELVYLLKSFQKINKNSPYFINVPFVRQIWMPCCPYGAFLGIFNSTTLIPEPKVSSQKIKETLALARLSKVLREDPDHLESVDLLISLWKQFPNQNTQARLTF